MRFEKHRQSIKISAHEFLNKQHEIQFVRNNPISGFLGSLFRGFKQSNVSLKALIKTGSFMRASAVLCEEPQKTDSGI